MSKAEIFIECPFCREQRANYFVRSLRVLDKDHHGRIHPDAKMSGIGDCYICGNHAMLYFSVDAAKAGNHPLSVVVSNLQNAVRKENGLAIAGRLLECVQTFPEPERLDTPDHLSKAVRKVFVEADANYRGRHWRSAVTSYGTVIDFACIEIMQNDRSAAQGMTLGQKMGHLRDQGIIPTSLVDLMETVNIDRRASVHYTKPVEECAARAVRSVTVATLEYLFTLPKNMEEAHTRLKAAKVWEK